MGAINYIVNSASELGARIEPETISSTKNVNEINDIALDEFESPISEMGHENHG
jgi:hypothetical protein